MFHFEAQLPRRAYPEDLGQVAWLLQDIRKTHKRTPSRIMINPNWMDRLSRNLDRVPGAICTPTGQSDCLFDVPVIKDPTILDGSIRVLCHE